MSDKEIRDLRINGIVPGSIAESIYQRYKKKHGQNHKEALKLTIAGISNIKSNCLDASTLEILKSALFSVQGQLDG